MGTYTGEIEPDKPRRSIFERAARNKNLETWAMGKYVVAGTGSRSFCQASQEHSVATLTRLSDLLAASLERHPNLAVLSGGAEGWDHSLALIAEKMGIPYALAIPNAGYGRYYWHEHSLLGKDRSAQWTAMIDGADAFEYTTDWLGIDMRAVRHEGLHLNFWRNVRMVEVADAFVVYNPASRGTSHCFRLIQEAGKPYRILG